MPLEAIAINSFEAPIMRELKSEGDLRERILKLYTSPASQIRLADTKGDNIHDIKGLVETNKTESEAAANKIMDIFTSAFKRGDLMYVGMFNDKPIAVVGCFDDGQTDTKRLQYLAMHPENINRGIEAKFIKLVYDKEVRKGVRRFMPVDEEIHQIMREYELISVKT